MGAHRQVGGVRAGSCQELCIGTSSTSNCAHKPVGFRGSRSEALERGNSLGGEECGPCALADGVNGVLGTNWKERERLHESWHT